tara:strand:+ start:93 stop:1286 length:1194 start_codon:yes stop_codon:yes gene_type:complete
VIEIPLFNITDILVFITLFITLLLALLTVAQRPLWRPANILLSAFFAAITLYSVDTIIYWNEAVHTIVVGFVPALFFTLGFALLLQGPLLFGYAQACFKPKFRWGWRQLWHLLPVFIFPIFLYATYFNRDAGARLLLIDDWSQVLADPGFYALIWFQRLSIWIYSLLSVLRFKRYQAELRGHGLSLKRLELRWHQVFFYGFFVINSLVLSALLLSLLTDLRWDSPLGVADSHLRFILACALLVYLIKGIGIVPTEVSDKRPEALAEALESEVAGDIATALEQEPIDHELQRVQEWMTTEQPYLDPLLTQEKLAQQLQLPPKTLSLLINQQLQQNFFEFICRYRVDAAKALLLDPEHRGLAVGKVMSASGFNSKSAFNQAFKKSVGMTPSQYRRRTEA